MKAIDPKLIVTVAFLIFAVGALVYSTNRTDLYEDQDRPFGLIPAQQQHAAPDFTLSTADGKQVKLSDAVKQGPVVLDFWATWCGPCHMEMPHLQRVYTNYKSKGVQLYGINSDASVSAIQEYAKQNDLTFPMLVDSKATVHSAYQVDEIPLILVIDKNMHVTAANDGYDQDTQADLSKTLDKLLAS